MEAFGICAGVLHIIKYSLLEELGRNTLLVLLLAEVARENLRGTIKDAQVDDVVVIYILYVQTILVPLSFTSFTNSPSAPLNHSRCSVCFSI